MLEFFAATPDLQGQLTFKPFPKGLLIGIGFPPPLSQMTINAFSSQTLRLLERERFEVMTFTWLPNALAAKVKHNITITQEMKMSGL